MRHLISLAALLVCGSITLGTIEAQTLVGLPQYGVTLEGDPGNPTIVNSSGRGILGHVIILRNGQGGGRMVRSLETRRERLGQSGSPSLPAFKSDTKSPITEAVLDAVIFDDGEFVGPDVGHSFDMMAARVNAERMLAQHVASRNGAVWDQLTAFFAKPPATSSTMEEVAQKEQHVLAGDLLATRLKHGEAAAFVIADRAAKHPKLWRQK